MLQMYLEHDDTTPQSTVLDQTRVNLYCSLSHRGLVRERYVRAAHDTSRAILLASIDDREESLGRELPKDHSFSCANSLGEPDDQGPRFNRQMTRCTFRKKRELFLPRAYMDIEPGATRLHGEKRRG
jgi:hypothetical protein